MRPRPAGAKRVGPGGRAIDGRLVVRNPFAARPSGAEERGSGPCGKPGMIERIGPFALIAALSLAGSGGCATPGDAPTPRRERKPGAGW